MQNRIQFVGHSCLWITLDDQHFMVDANLSPFVFRFFKRHSPVGIDIDNLPQWSGLLVTHAHYDVLDIFSYKYFSQKIPIFTPPGLGAFIKRFIHNPIMELTPWQTYRLGSTEITSVPNKHKGSRLSGLRYTKSCGFVFKGSTQTIYVSGDSAYGNHFKEVANRFKIDVACLPIGNYQPRWLKKNKNMSPEEAIKACEKLKAKIMIPIKWGAFRFGWTKPDAPLKDLKKAMELNTRNVHVKILTPGESLILTS